MRTTTRQKPELDLTVTKPVGKTFNATLEDGRVVSIRPMIGKDFIFVEKNLVKCGETEKAFKLLERLSVEPNKITYVEILELSADDIATLSESLAQANGVTMAGSGAEDDDAEVEY